MKLLISSCLLGEKVRYDGNHNKIDSKLFESILENNLIFSFCPELEGGLKTPRQAAEINNYRVVTKDGQELSEAFDEGAQKALLLCKKEDIKIALLKNKSPSCGNNLIYDGNFSNTLIKKSGICAKKLKENGILVFNENELELLSIALKS